jgi:hypothetical protein
MRRAAAITAAAILALQAQAGEKGSLNDLQAIEFNSSAVIPLVRSFIDLERGTGASESEILSNLSKSVLPVYFRAEATGPILIGDFYRNSRQSVAHCYMDLRVKAALARQISQNFETRKPAALGKLRRIAATRVEKQGTGFEIFFDQASQSQANLVFDRLVCRSRETANLSLSDIERIVKGGVRIVRASARSKQTAPDSVAQKYIVAPNVWAMKSLGSSTRSMP